ncbi:MAG: hypothetical protein WD578_13375 [Bacteroidales bacterium]
MNPVETGTGLKLNISETVNALDMDLAWEVNEFFRIPGDRAREIITEVKSAVRNWKAIATKYGISRSEQELKAMACQRAER